MSHEKVAQALNRAHEEDRLMRWFAIAVLAVMVVGIIVGINNRPTPPSSDAAQAVNVEAVPLREFHKADIKRIVDVSRTNELQFAREFKNQKFTDLMPFNRAIQRFGFGSYQVYFGQEFSGVLCFVSDANLLKRITDWHQGMLVQVEGIITATAFGDVHLDHCKLY